MDGRPSGVGDDPWLDPNWLYDDLYTNDNLEYMNPNMKSIDENTNENEEEIDVDAVLKHQKRRGTVNIIAGVGEILVGTVIAPIGVLSGDDTLPAAGMAWVLFGVRNIGYGIHDVVRANSGVIVENPTGPLPSVLYIDW